MKKIDLVLTICLLMLILFIVSPVANPQASLQNSPRPTATNVPRPRPVLTPVPRVYLPVVLR